MAKNQFCSKFTALSSRKDILYCFATKNSLRSLKLFKTSLVDYKNYGVFAEDAVRDIASRIGKQGQFLNWINILIENQIKNLDNIYKMADKAKANGDDELAVIGIGGSRHTTEAMINMLGCEDKVHLYSALDPKSFERFAKNICAFITNDYAND